MRDGQLSFAEGVCFPDPDKDIAGCIQSIPALMERYFPDVPPEGKALPSGEFIEAAGERSVSLDTRFKDFKSFKRQIEWFSGRAAFSSLSRRVLGGSHALGISDGGAPYIEGSPLTVSITHSGDYAAAAISLNPSWLLGIDMERIRGFQHKGSFLKVAFPEEPPSFADSLSDDELMERWTLKEAFLKIIRKGFAENLGQVKILPDRFVYRGRPIDTLRRKTVRFDGHILSFVYGEMEHV